MLTGPESRVGFDYPAHVAWRRADWRLSAASCATQADEYQFCPQKPFAARDKQGPRKEVKDQGEVMAFSQTTERELLRHVLASMTYRAAKAIRNTPDGFGAFRLRDGSRTPLEILAHIGDLCDWGLTLAKGQEQWHDAPPRPWDDERSRFFASVKSFDDFLAGSSPIACSVQRLVQGPVADALTHVGQIAMVRRIFGSPIRGENYFKADIHAGQVGPDQPPPRKEFD
jgi:hypothetical protein